MSGRKDYDYKQGKGTRCTNTTSWDSVILNKIYLRGLHKVENEVTIFFKFEEMNYNIQMYTLKDTYILKEVIWLLNTSWLSLK